MRMVPGSVIVDVAVDQGGCIETTVETTHERPGGACATGSCTTAWATSPRAVPHTSTYALTNATFPYALTVADRGVRGAVEADPALGAGVLCASGQLTNTAVAEALGRRAVAPLEALPTCRG